VVQEVKKKSKPSRPAPRAANESHQVAVALCDLVDVVAVAVSGLGDLAKLTADERATIVPAAERTLDRLSPEVLARVQAISDPVLLVSAFAFYGARLVATKRALAETKTTEAEPPKAPPAPSASSAAERDDHHDDEVVASNPDLAAWINLP
jgi:hypothetical protein